MRFWWSWANGKGLGASENLSKPKGVKILKGSLAGRLVSGLGKGGHHRRQWVTDKNWKIQGSE